MHYNIQCGVYWSNNVTVAVIFIITVSNQYFMASEMDIFNMSLGVFQMIGDSEMQVSLAKPPTDSKVKEKRKLQHMLLLGRG